MIHDKMSEEDILRIRAELEANRLDHEGRLLGDRSTCLCPAMDGSHVHSWEARCPSCGVSHAGSSGWPKAGPNYMGILPEHDDFLRHFRCPGSGQTIICTLEAWHLLGAQAA